MNWNEILTQVGTVGVILLALIAGGRALFKRLFDPQTGILIKISDRHLAFVDSVEKNQEKQKAAIQEQANTIAALLEMHSDPNSSFSTVKTNEALYHLLEALRYMGAEVKGNNKQQLERHLDKAKEGLALQA